ncbi:MAG: S8 family peptidase [Lachnospiraceae bacterium]|nr:S8 family peptidase [Lachnospiraceae bacterium]
MGFLDLVNHREHYYDDNGHGTHIAGILAGNGSGSNGLYRGIAPDCQIFSMKVLNHNGEGRIEHVLKAIDWLLAHHMEYHIRIVNISIGSTRGRNFGEDSPLVRGVNSLWEHGMIVLTAAGNHGPTPGSIGAPGNSRKIITVGSSDPLQYRTSSDYSSRGPTNSCIKKPDIVAPGSRIVSCHPTPRNDNNGLFRNNATYQARSGTSMSTPIVSGCLALLLEQTPSLTNREVKMHLRNTSLDLGYSHTRQGWGLLQCDRLLQQPPVRF